MDSLDSDRSEATRYDRRASDRASLDRIEALRTRPPAEPPRRSVAPWVIAAMLMVFALGLIANPWFESRVRRHLPGFTSAAATASEAELAAERDARLALAAKLAALEGRVAAARPPAAAGGLDTTRMTRAETRIDDLVTAQNNVDRKLGGVAADVAALGVRVDATAATAQATLAAATQGADAAQAVLLLGSTRRLLEAGARLGTLEPLLQRQFGARYPQPTAALLALSAAPVTPASLHRDLLALRPALTGTAPVPAAGASWWSQFTAGLDGIARLRPSGGPGAANDPGARVEAALRALNSGDVATAAAQVAALPPAARGTAAAWQAAALRWQAGMRALATLDAAALLPPAAAHP